MIGIMTSISPDEVAPHERPITLVSPDGEYFICRFKQGQVIQERTYFWGVVRSGEEWPLIYTRNLEDAMAWFGRHLLETCF